MKWTLKAASVGVLIALMISACGADNDHAAGPTALPEPTITTLSATPNLPAALPIQLYTTQNNLLGNHFSEGSIDLQNAPSMDIPLDGEPLWLVSAPFEEGVIFVAVLEAGQIRAFKITGRSYELVDMSPDQLPAGMPPLLAISEDSAQLIIPPQDASPLTNPILIGNRLVHIGANGDLVSSGSTSPTHLAINALPDARILKDENGRLLILTGPTDRYPHGVLGDELEASGITLIETEPELRVVRNIPIAAPDVVEGISPIWADLDDDGVREIIVTLSNAQSGARLAAFREDGALLAEGPALGLGQRWRHQIAVAAFAPGNPALIVAIRTPHIGGVVEFYQRNGRHLEIVKEITGFSAHAIGSRNLDSALAGDFNNDGVSELLAPDQSHTHLGVISPAGDVTTIALEGVLTSNLSATVIDGNLMVGAGTRGNLRIWIP